VDALQPIVNILPLQLLSYHLTTIRCAQHPQPAPRTPRATPQAPSSAAGSPARPCLALTAAGTGPRRAAADELAPPSLGSGVLSSVRSRADKGHHLVPSNLRSSLTQFLNA
jgi:hypothetical protein